MKQLIAITIALVFFISIVEFIPTTNAPKGKKSPLIEASVFDEKTESSIRSSFSYQDPEIEALLELLELYVEEQRDLPTAQNFIEQVPKNDANEKILELYQAKILSRSLDFTKAKQLLELIDHENLALLKTAVLIASSDRNEAGAYLHELVENHPSPQVKSEALSLLQIYNNYDTHRDIDESYLWTLFAQKIGEWNEFEISLYLAEKALERNKDYRDAWIIKGFDELNLNKPELAEESLLTAYKFDPGNPQIQYLLGLTYYKLNKSDLSTQYLLYAMQNETKYQDIILDKLAENAINYEDYALASHYYQTLLEIKQDNKHILSQLIWIHAEKLDQLEKAEEYARKLVEAHSSDPNSYQLLSWVLNEKGDMEESLKYLEKAKELESNQVE